jgi:hypothetical protein
MWTLCEECRQLWREYALATTDHVRLGTRHTANCLPRVIRHCGMKPRTGRLKRQLGFNFIHLHNSQRIQLAVAGPPDAGDWEVFDAEILYSLDSLLLSIAGRRRAARSRPVCRQACLLSQQTQDGLKGAGVVSAEEH